MLIGQILVCNIPNFLHRFIHGIIIGWVRKHVAVRWGCQLWICSFLVLSSRARLMLAESERCTNSDVRFTEVRVILLTKNETTRTSILDCLPFV